MFALALNLFMPALFPALNLTFFAPFLVVSFYKKPLFICLWFALICGVVLDLLASEHRLGLHAINYCLATWLLYDQKRNFFEDSLSTLPIMTFFFSVISTGIQAILLYIFEHGIAFSWEWAGTDLVIMPLCDAAYAFVSFTIPFILMSSKTRRSGDEYFSNP